MRHCLCIRSDDVMLFVAEIDYPRLETADYPLYQPHLGIGSSMLYEDEGLSCSVYFGAVKRVTRYDVRVGREVGFKGGLFWSLDGRLTRDDGS